MSEIIDKVLTLPRIEDNFDGKPPKVVGIKFKEPPKEDKLKAKKLVALLEK